MTDQEKVAELPQQSPQPTPVKCAIVPLELMDEIRDALKEAPYKIAKPVLNQLSTVPVQDVMVLPNDRNRNPN